MRPEKNIVYIPHPEVRTYAQAVAELDEDAIVEVRHDRESIIIFTRLSRVSGGRCIDASYAMSINELAMSRVEADRIANKVVRDLWERIDRRIHQEGKA